METTGKIHDYLGLQINYSLPGKVVLSMFEYLENIVMEAPADLKPNNCNYLCNANLFQVNKTSPKLDPETTELFHRLVVRLLFAAKRSRPDIQLSVAFLCSHVKNPTKEDYRKLGSVIRYIQRTIHLPLVLGSDGSGKVTWNINPSYAAHPDMPSHTRAICFGTQEHSFIIIETENYNQKLNKSRISRGQ